MPGSDCQKSGLKWVPFQPAFLCPSGKRWHDPLFYPKSYGTRHRAAIGMSEISDAIIVVVSEETGEISIAQGGEIRQRIDPVRLQQTLQRYLTINSRKRSKKEVAE